MFHGCPCFRVAPLQLCFAAAHGFSLSGCQDGVIIHQTLRLDKYAILPLGERHKVALADIQASRISRGITTWRRCPTRPIFSREAVLLTMLSDCLTAYALCATSDSRISPFVAISMHVHAIAIAPSASALSASGVAQWCANSGW